MPLTASLTIEPSEADAPEAFVARFRLVNQGADVVGVNQAVLSSPSLALEIMDAAGEPVLLPPPPVPPASPPIERLEAAEETTAEFAGFLPSWTEPGTYRARSRYAAGSGEPINSDWVEFTLRRAQERTSGGGDPAGTST